MKASRIAYGLIIALATAIVSTRSASGQADPPSYDAPPAPPAAAPAPVPTPTPVPDPGSTTTAPAAPPAAPAADACQLDLQDCKGDLTGTTAALETCQADQKFIANNLRAFCHAELTPDEILQHMHDRTVPPPKRAKPPGTSRTTKPPKPTAPGPTALVVWGQRELVEAGDEKCPNGGYMLPVGLDLNRNGQLDNEEIRARLPACNGKDGAPGARLLSTSERFASSETCPNGGNRILTWTDSVANGYMEDEELRDEREECDGRTPEGHDGLDGRPGRDGTSVSLGLALNGDLFPESEVTPEIRSSSFGLVFHVQRNWAEAAVMANWSPGLKHGALLGTDFAAYWPSRHVAPRIGAQLFYADFNSRNQPEHQLILLTPGAAARVIDWRHLKFRVEGHVGIGMAGTYGNFEFAWSVGGSGYLLGSF